MRTMKDKLFSLLRKEISADRIRKNAEEIRQLEGDESYRNYKASTDFVIRMLEEAGFEQIERIALPSDGKTTFFDCIMPQAWDSAGRSFIRLEDETMSMDERMIVDTDKDPFDINFWSAPTPEGGIDCEVTEFCFTEANAKECRGKLVLMDGFSQKKYKLLAMNDAAGVIISASKAGENYPEYKRWCNAIGYTGWYLTAEDKRIPAFSISPRDCDFLHKRLTRGKLTAHAEAKCRVYDGEIYTVTGVMPGKTDEEIIMVAHMYEPFQSDDAAGGSVIAEICRSLKTLIAQKQLSPLQKTLRIVLSFERYGYHQYFMNSQRNKRSLALFSFDSCCHILGEDQNMKVRCSSILQPSFMDLYLPELMRRNLPHRIFSTEKGNLSDDTFCSDDTIGIPSLWLHTSNMRYHHNFGPAFMNADWDLAHDIAAVMGTLIGKIATGNSALFRSIHKQCGQLAVSAMKDRCTMIRLEFEDGKLSGRDAAEKVRFYQEKILKQLSSVKRFCPGISSAETGRTIRSLATAAIKWFHVSEGGRELFGAMAKANQISVLRLVPGTLMSMIRVPHAERRRVDIPDVLYMLFDGKRTVYESVKLYEYENDIIFSEDRFKTMICDLYYLAKYGYVKIIDLKSSEGENKKWKLN